MNKKGCQVIRAAFFYNGLKTVDMGKICWPLILFFYAFALQLQAQDAIADDMQKNLDRLAKEENERFRQSFARAQQYARLQGVPLISYDNSGNVIQLVDVDDFGAPVYRSTTNAGAAITAGVTKLRQNGGLGLNLEGSGITIGIWDGGVVFDHSEFDSRVAFKENNTVSDHGTHVAGTMMAAGLNPSARGMAGRASLISYFWDNDISEMAAQARPDQASLILSNHSYGLIQGWNCTTPTSCVWTGTPSISTLEDWRFGFYTNVSRSLDETAFNAPFYSIFWAAGNDRDDSNTSGTGGTNPPDGNGGTVFDSMSQEGCAKNIFTIGAIGKIPDYTGPGSVQMS
ncbi:MAG: S8 family serine peptidase, partial [Flammeovirgaceae bacterium]